MADIFRPFGYQNQSNCCKQYSTAKGDDRMPELVFQPSGPNFFLICQQPSQGNASASAQCIQDNSRYFIHWRMCRALHVRVERCPMSVACLQKPARMQGLALLPGFVSFGLPWPAAFYLEVQRHAKKGTNQYDQSEDDYILQGICNNNGTHDIPGE